MPSSFPTKLNILWQSYRWAHEIVPVWHIAGADATGALRRAAGAPGAGAAARLAAGGDEGRAISHAGARARRRAGRGGGGGRGGAAAADGL